MLLQQRSEGVFVLCLLQVVRGQLAEFGGQRISHHAPPEQRGRDAHILSKGRTEREREKVVSISTLC